MYWLILQGVPGFSYAICRKTSLAMCEGNCRSLSLDLFDQDKNMEKTKQFRCVLLLCRHIKPYYISVVNIVIWSYFTFRFTPPTHTILAFRQALKEFYEEGGLNGREKRYKENRAVLKSGMAEMGFKELVPEEFAGHIITCFFYPKHENFSFETFYKKLSDIGNYWGF